MRGEVQQTCNSLSLSLSLSHTHTHTHTHPYMLALPHHLTACLPYLRVRQARHARLPGSRSPRKRGERASAALLLSHARARESREKKREKWERILVLGLGFTF